MSFEHDNTCEEHIKYSEDISAYELWRVKTFKKGSEKVSGDDAVSWALFMSVVACIFSVVALFVK